jgi:hypothetical protein
MARRNYREYLLGETVRRKKYLYVLRPLLATLWIEQGRGVAPMPFQELVDAIVTDSDLLGAIDQLLAIKRAVGEGEHGSPFPIINAFIDAELSRLETVLPPVLRDTDYSILDRLLMDTVLAGDQEMSHYKPYPAYRDSGVKWIGQVPEHWKKMPFKRVASICNGHDYKEVENADGAYPVIGSGGEFARASDFMLTANPCCLGAREPSTSPCTSTAHSGLSIRCFTRRSQTTPFPSLSITTH